MFRNWQSKHKSTNKTNCNHRKPSRGERWMFHELTKCLHEDFMAMITCSGGETWEVKRLWLLACSWLQKILRKPALDDIDMTGISNALLALRLKSLLVSPREIEKNNVKIGYFPWNRLGVKLRLPPVSIQCRMDGFCGFLPLKLILPTFNYKKIQIKTITYHCRIYMHSNPGWLNFYDHRLPLTHPWQIPCKSDSNRNVGGEIVTISKP